MQFISPNELLTALPPVIYERLASRLQRVRLEAGRILFDVGATIDHTWFITGGIVSLLGVRFLSYHSALSLRAREDL